MKDIIHDINTPISAIKLNLKLIDNSNEEIESISKSVNILEMLHKNLDNYLNNTPLNIEEYNIGNIINKQVIFFENLYDWITWEKDISYDTIKTDSYLLSRIIYNLLSNASKYNTKNGFIKVSYKNKILKISNSSYGIKNLKKVFDRFYKESDRGLGIGLHIVAKLLKQLDYKYSFTIDDKNVVTMQIIMK